MKEAPCKGCKERFTACSDRCPIDLRGAMATRPGLPTTTSRKPRNGRCEFKKTMMLTGTKETVSQARNGGANEDF